MDWSFNWNRSRPETAGDWLIFYFAVPFAQFLFFGLLMGADTALKLFGAGMLLVLAFGEINAMMERRDGKDAGAIDERMRAARKVGVVICAAMLAAYAVQATVFPEARLGVGQAFLIIVAELVILGIVNNRKRQ